MSPSQQHAFDVFWGAYPRRVGKLAAMREWERKSPELSTVLEALDWQRKDWTDVRYIPHPRTWLSQGRWMDERLPTLGHAPEPWWQECERLGHSPRCANLAWHQVVMSRP